MGKAAYPTWYKNSAYIPSNHANYPSHGTLDLGVCLQLEQHVSRG